MYSKEQRPHFINNGFVWSWKCHEKWPLQMYSADPIHLLFVIANNNVFVSYYKSNGSILMWFLYRVLRIFFQDITMCPVERKKKLCQFNSESSKLRVCTFLEKEAYWSDLALRSYWEVELTVHVCKWYNV